MRKALFRQSYTEALQQKPLFGRSATHSLDSNTPCFGQIGFGNGDGKGTTNALCAFDADRRINQRH